MDTFEVLRTNLASPITLAFALGYMQTVCDAPQSVGWVSIRAGLDHTWRPCGAAKTAGNKGELPMIWIWAAFVGFVLLWLAVDLAVAGETQVGQGTTGHHPDCSQRRRWNRRRP